MVLDSSTLQRLALMSDPLGVLSIYATMDPTEASAEKPAWRLRIRNELETLRTGVMKTGPRDLDMAVRRRLHDLRMELEWLQATGVPGRGRAIFAPLSSTGVEQVAIQLELGNRAVCEPLAYIRPLLDAWAIGSPTGIAVAGGDGLRIVDHRLGQADDVATLTFDEDVSEWRELKGPANVQPGRAHQTAPQRTLFDYRLTEHRKQFLAATHNTLERYARELGWDFLIVAGEPELRDAVIEHIAPDCPSVIVRSRHTIGPATPARVAETVADEIEAARLHRDESLINQVREDKQAAWGLDETLTAVQQGQASVVLMNQDASWSGRRTDDGQFVPSGVVPPGVDCGELTDEPDLAERIIEMAYRNDTRIAMIRPQVAEPLAEADGVAALLRW